AAASAAIDGASAPEIIDIALRAAAQAERQWPAPTDGKFADAVRDMHRDLRRWSELQPAGVSVRYFPNHPMTIVPLALALATVMESADAAILLAANVGGDSDSVASIAGGILGARSPGAVNDEWFAAVEQVNGHD